MSQNPYRQALLAIAVFGGIVAAIVFGVAAIPNPGADIADPFYWIIEVLPRVPWVLLSGFLASVSAGALLLWLHSSAKRWVPTDD